MPVSREKETYNLVDARIELDWLENRLRALSSKDSEARFSAVKQVRGVLERFQIDGIEQLKHIVEAMLARERCANARQELTYLLQAVGGKKPFADATLLDNVTMDTLRKCIRDLGTHEVRRPEDFAELGLPAAFIAAVKRKHDGVVWSDGSIGGVGVSSLDFLRGLADRLGVDSRTGYIGRGRQVEALRERVLTVLALRK